MKRGDTKSPSMRKLRAVFWNNRGEVYVLSNRYISLVEGDFKEGGKAVKQRL
jgi:hypothetical protein